MEKNQKKIFKIIIICAILCIIIVFIGLFYLIYRELHFKYNADQNVFPNSESQENINSEDIEEENEVEIGFILENSDEINDDYEDENLDLNFIQYYQGDYADIPWCGGNIADCGSAVTSIAMIFTNLLQKEITPKSAAVWCKYDDYYEKNAGMSLAYINAATSYFNRVIGSNVTCKETIDIEEVYSEMKKGALCISLQVEGRFTASNHFIVLSRNI